MLKLAPYNPSIPADVIALAEKVRKEIVAGTRHSFQGPIKDQGGKLVVPEGEVLDDGALLSMNWYVDGVVGKLPK
jgi:simple sugar transport system substrate-binding protein